MIRLIDNDEWDRCRTIWTLSINESIPDGHGHFSFFSTEHGVFTKHFINFQQVSYFCLNFNTLISNMGGEFLLLNSFNSTIQINVE